jgi:hypothetical protein
MVTSGTAVGNVDLAILTLNTDLPADVEPVKILPKETYNKLTLDITNTVNSRDGCLWKYLPAIATDQLKGAYAGDIYLWYVSGLEVFVVGSAWFPSWANGYEPWGGDSGHPIFVVINGELVLAGCWYGRVTDHFALSSSQGSSSNNNQNIWLGFAFDTSTNTIVAESVSRWSIKGSSNDHALNFLIGSGAILSSTIVTAEPNRQFYSSSDLKATSGYPFNGWLTLPAHDRYYLLSQEKAGGDYWYGWPGTTNGDIQFFSIPGAAASTDLRSFVVYTNGADPHGSTFGPVDFNYFVYPHSGYTSMPGGDTNGINEVLSNSGPQYTVTVYDLSAFPNNLR